MNYKNIFLATFIILSACSKYASNGESLYLRSENNVLPVISPPLSSENISYFYKLRTPASGDPIVNIEPPQS